MERFEQRRFRTAARHYLAGRPAYAERLIARVAEVCGLRTTDRVMDLGCGPGQLARAFAPYVQDVLALDPEPEMLRAARDAWGGVSNIEWREGSSTDLSEALGRFRMVCMGRSFHWMGRAETLRQLDRLIEAEGAVVLLHDTHSQVPDNAWYAGYRAILDRYATGDPARAMVRAPGWVRHEGVLLDSAFAQLEEIAVIERREVEREALVERALSMSSTSRARLGERADEMVAELRRELPDHVREVVASVALIGRRE